MKSLREIIECRGPQIFENDMVNAQVNLFQERSALIYTPTENIPPDWVGFGTLNITIPIPTPSYYDFIEIKAYQSPRLWIDLIQRASGKIRWKTFFPAVLRIIRYDVIKISDNIGIAGCKSLIDALKYKTTGRRDRLYLYYFGAIFDDSPTEVHIEFEQVVVESPIEARTQIIVNSY